MADMSEDWNEVIDLYSIYPSKMTSTMHIYPIQLSTYEYNLFSHNLFLSTFVGLGRIKTLFSSTQ